MVSHLVAESARTLAHVLLVIALFFSIHILFIVVGLCHFVQEQIDLTHFYKLFIRTDFGIDFLLDGFAHLGLQLHLVLVYKIHL